MIFNINIANGSISVDLNIHSSTNSEIEKKMNIMGITPFTLTVFLVGFIIS